MAEFPRVHWKSINDKNVPFTEPQHFTGEGDEVVRTGDKNPLPTKDKEVLLELESIKAENEEIKQKQKEILERLDKPIDTQVTGSNVEDGIKVQQNGVFTELSRTLNKNVTSGSRTTILNIQPSESLYYSKIIIIFRSESKHNLSIDIDWSVPSETFGTIYGETKVVSGNFTWGSSEEIKIKATGFTVKLINGDSEKDHHYDVYVYGVI